MQVLWKCMGDIQYDSQKVSQPEKKSSPSFLLLLSQGKLAFSGLIAWTLMEEVYQYPFKMVHYQEA